MTKPMTMFRVGLTPPLPEEVEAFLHAPRASAREWAERADRVLRRANLRCPPPPANLASDLCAVLHGTYSEIVHAGQGDPKPLHDAMLWRPWTPWSWYAMARFNVLAGATERAALLLLLADQACERIAKSWPYLLDIGEPCPRDLSVEILDQLVLLLDGLVVRWTGRKRPERVALIQRDLDWLVAERLPVVRARREEPARGPAPVLESAGPKGLKIPLSGQPLFGGLVSRPMTWRTSSGFLFRLPRSFGGTAI